MSLFKKFNESIGSDTSTYGREWNLPNYKPDNDYNNRKSVNESSSSDKKDSSYKKNK